MFFERPLANAQESGQNEAKYREKAILVHINMSDQACAESSAELYELVISAGANPINCITGSRSQPHPRTYVGNGKVEQIRQAIQTWQAEIVIFNHTLSPTQERNLEQELRCRVIDRTGLILDIFAQRARTMKVNYR